jgi:Transposase IS4
VASKIRLACQQNWELGSHLAIDEAMVPCGGHSSHTIMIKNKPIKEGYEVWVLGDQGYVWYWLWYSAKTGTEGIPKKGQFVDLPGENEQVYLATTFATVVRLAQQLPDNSRVYCLFLDNLFININFCQALLALNVVTMGATRKNAAGMPQRLVGLKNQNQTMVWNFASAEIVDDTKCFVWQDNNAVLGMTAAF